jgi:hypothetical protein
MECKLINRTGASQPVTGTLSKQKDWQPLREDNQPFQVVPIFLLFTIIQRPQRFLSIHHVYINQD